MDDYVVITINGVEYYCPSNMVQYITNDLINTSSTTITLYRDIATYNSQHYPQIRLGSYSEPVYYSANGQPSALTVQSVVFSDHAKFVKAYSDTSLVSVYLLGILAFFVMFRRFK